MLCKIVVTELYLSTIPNTQDCTLQMPKTYCYGLNSSSKMWPDLRKPDIMAHTKILSIKHYKNLVQKCIS